MAIKKTLADIKFSQVKDTFWVSFRMLKVVWNIDHKLFLASVVGILIPGIVPFVNLYIYKLLIDAVVAVVAGATFDPYVFYPLIIARIISYFAQSEAFRVQGLVERLLWTKVPIYLNQIIFKKITSLDIHYLEDDKFRDQLEKVRESYNHRPQGLVDNLFYAMQSLVQTMIALVALAYLNWIFVILIIAVAIPEFINQSMRSKLAWGIWNAHSPLQKRYRYLTHLLEGPREFKEVKLFRLAKTLLKEMKEIQLRFYTENKALAVKDFKFGVGFDILSTVVFIGIELYVLFETLARRLTVGDINFYTGVVSNFQKGIGGLLRNINQVY
jgi:ABC-type multidrug transport system fused ATPase/permease subunit